MKLRNKDDGRTREFGIDETNSFPYYLRDELGNTFRAKTLKEIADKWEDYEEPKESKYLYVIDPNRVSNIRKIYKEDEPDWCEQALELGIGFETVGEAEKAVEKLKAWQRLEDKGFRFEGIKEDYTRILQSQVPFRTGKRYLQFNKSEDKDWMKENWKDLDLLFSGGEE